MRRAVFATLLAGALAGLVAMAALRPGCCDLVPRLFEDSPLTADGTCFGGICIAAPAPN